MAATGAEIASAYVTITTKMPGIQKDIAKQLGSVDGEAIGSQLGGKISAGLTKTVKVAGAGVAAVLGTALVKGFNRLKAIENAQAKMRGLGFDAKTVQTAMDNALASVKGTAFGLGEAATVASGAMAAQIKPGKELEQHLTRIANNASAAGVGFDEMGALFNKAATQANGVQNDVIGMLADKGIPIYKEIGRIMGVTSGEVFKLASDGKVSFEVFSQAAEAAAGTVASEMGNTTTGAFDNMMAALGRLGAKILEDIFPLIGPLFKSITAWLDEAITHVEPVVSWIGERLPGAIQRTRDFFADLFGWVQSNKDWLVPTLVAIGSFVAVMKVAKAVTAAWKGAVAAVKAVQMAYTAYTYGMAGATYTYEGASKAGAIATRIFNAALKANPIGIVVTAVAALAAGLVYFFTQTETGRKVWAEFTRFLGEAWDNIVKFTTEAVENTVSFVKDHWGLLLSIIIGPLGLAIQWVVEHWGEITKFFSEAWENIKTTFTNAINTLVQLFLDWTPLGQIIKNWDAIAAFFSDLWGEISLVFGKFIELITAFIMEWTPLGLIIKNWGAITAWFGEFWNKIVTFFSNMIDTVVQLFLDWTPLGQIIQNWGAITAWFSQFWEGVKGVFRAALDWIVQMILDWTVFGLIIKNWDAIKQFFINVWNAILNVVRTVLDAVSSVVQTVLGFISSVWTNVWNGIKSFFAGIWNGIIGVVNWYINTMKTGISNGINFVSTVWTNVWNGIKNTLSNVWLGIKATLDTLISFVKDGPVRAFEKARDAIGTAWAGIQDLAKKPVKFVIETVINGLIGTVNKILPDGMKIPTMPLPKGFSDGGYTGNLAPTAVAGVVHGNEHVIRAASRAKIEARHPGLLDHMNRTGSIPGYKKGGFVHPLPGAVITEEYGGYPGHKGIDMALPAGSPIRAAASGLVNFSGWYGGGGWMAGIDHRNGFVTHYKHMMSPPPVKAGQPVAQGQVIGFEGSTGDSTGPHLHFETILNGNRLNPRNFMSFDGSDSGDGGFFNLLGGLKEGLLGKLKAAFPEGGMFVDVAAGLASSAIDGSLDFVKSMLGFHKDNEPKLYDNGGWLQPGLSLVANKTGAPERILTDSQWDALADRGSGSGVFHLYDSDGVLFGTMRGIADDAVDDSLADQARARRFAGG